jgi:hypothetical protein
MMRGDLAALRMLPLMWKKRRALAPSRKLTPGQTLDLLMRHRISLKQLSESSVAAPRVTP